MISDDTGRPIAYNFAIFSRQFPRNGFAFRVVAQKCIEIVIH